MSAPTPDPQALARVRGAIVVVAVTLFVISLGVALAGVWPVPWLDRLAFEWLGATSWRWRITGTFAVLGGGFLLPVLLVLAVVVNLWRALRGRGGSA